MDSDDLLIELMCEDNYDAIKEFERRYMIHIRTWLKPFSRVIKFLRMDEEDFVGILYVKVYDSLSYFNRNQGNFYSFAKSCVNNYMCSYVKKMNGSMRRTIYDSVSLDSHIDSDQSFYEIIRGEYKLCYPKNFYDDKESLSVLKNALDNLSEDEKR